MYTSTKLVANLESKNLRCSAILITLAKTLLHLPALAERCLDSASKRFSSSDVL